MQQIPFPSWMDPQILYWLTHMPYWNWQQELPWLEPMRAAVPPGLYDPLDQLKKLAELLGEGVIRDEEFAVKKDQLLSRV